MPYAALMLRSSADCLKAECRQMQSMGPFDERLFIF